ncbi:LADA_0E01574g1_1 [Lachancea dasiensis]|uniref:LADA_0E01574g1_1 n=1 Tax=Lachancea dasiensis TaxID=1072105 RepID=A0A1G4JAG6_9SACH|nr:LADA_0E01574g1_1 [Lachancea dasiensis]
METDLNRKRSNSALPTIQRIPGKGKDKPRTRFYSISSTIVPQTIQVGERDNHEKEEGRKTAESKQSSPALQSMSKVGFQSIYQNPGLRKSQKAVDVSGRYRTTSSNSSVKSNGMASYQSYQSGSNISAISNKTSQNSLSGKITGRGSYDNLEPDLKTVPSANKSLTDTSSSFGKLSTGTKRNPFSKAARKLFSRNAGRADKIRESVKSPTSGTSSAFGKFLNSKYGKHVGSYHKHSAGALMDGGKNPPFGSRSNSGNDVPLQLAQQPDLDSSDIQMLQDLIKNLKSLRSTYRTFTTEELDALMSNIWGVFCSVVVTLFKNKELWELPAKIEDLNHVLSFYIQLKMTPKKSSGSSKFVAEIEEFMATCLYILENQIVFNYSNENTINTALKRLCLIWGIFYHQIYHNFMAIFLPLEVSFRVDNEFWSESQTNFARDTLNGTRAGPLSLDVLLLKSFRDSIVSPYYESFINSHEGASKSFHLYIMNEEEEKGVTQEDKLTLLQCFGILSSIRSVDIKQKVIDELLAGIRMSI